MSYLFPGGCRHFFYSVRLRDLLWNLLLLLYLSTLNQLTYETIYVIAMNVWTRIWFQDLRYDVSGVGKERTIIEKTYFKTPCYEISSPRKCLGCDCFTSFSYFRVPIPSPNGLSTFFLETIRLLMVLKSLRTLKLYIYFH